MIIKEKKIMKKITLLAPLFVMALTSCGSTRVTNEGKEISKEKLVNGHVKTKVDRLFGS